jgi:hypothetical protein
MGVSISEVPSPLSAEFAPLSSRNIFPLREMHSWAEASRPSLAAVSWCLAGLAGVAVLDEEPERAARLWGAAEALRLSIGLREAPAARATHKRLMAEVREQLGEAAFDAAWAVREAMPWEAAVEYALGD